MFPFKITYRKSTNRTETREVWSKSEKQARKKFHRLFPNKFEIIAVAR